MTEPLDRLGYFMAGGDVCPSCQAMTLGAAPFARGSGEGTQDRECGVCAATWTDVYMLVRYDDLDGPAVVWDRPTVSETDQLRDMALEYVLTQGAGCPVCHKRTTQPGTLIEEAHCIRQYMRCLACQATWQKVYTLKTCEELKR